MATITYDGKTITLVEGKTYTLKCKDKVFKTDIVIELGEGESVGDTGEPSVECPEQPVTVYNQFAYNQTAKTISEGYSGKITYQCAGKKASRNLRFHNFVMVELSGRYVMQEINSSYTVADDIYPDIHYDVQGMRVPIVFSVGTAANSEVYYEFYIVDEYGEFPTYLIDVDGNERYIGDKYKFNDGNGDLIFHFNSPTKVPENFYELFISGAKKT